MQGWSFLSQGSMSRGAGNQFRWQAKAKAGEQLFISSLNNPERNSRICACLSEITGQECSFTAVSQDAAPADDGSDEAYLNTIYETFGKEPVDVVDDIR